MNNTIYGGTTVTPIAVPKVDLTDYVKKTDYGSKDNAGVVKSNSNYGININATNGVMSIVRAEENTIDNKTDGYRPITPKHLDYAVKSGLSATKIEWTEEEKASARNLIGVGDTNTIPMARTGELLTLSNVSSTEHELGVKVRGKNLITGKPDFTPLREIGLEVTDNGDGTYTINGQVDDEAELTVFTDVDLEVGNTYTFTMNFDHINGTGPTYANLLYTDGEYVCSSDETFVAAETKCKCTARFGCGFPYENFTFAPQIEAGDVITEFSPPIDVENATVSVLGKNMVILEPHTEDFYGATITYGEDGSISINGLIKQDDIPNGNFVTAASFEVPLNKNGVYVITPHLAGEYAEHMQVALYDSDDNYIDVLAGYDYRKYSIVKNLDKIIIKIRLRKQPEFVDGSCKIQIEAGEIPTSFEKGVVKKYKPNSNGIVEGIKSSPKMTLKTLKGAVLDVDYKVDTKTYIDEKFAELAAQIV